MSVEDAMVIQPGDDALARDLVAQDRRAHGEDREQDSRWEKPCVSETICVASAIQPCVPAVVQASSA
jgi:hypothetical protein